MMSLYIHLVGDSAELKMKTDDSAKTSGNCFQCAHTEHALPQTENEFRSKKFSRWERGAQFESVGKACFVLILAAVCFESFLSTIFHVCGYLY